MSPAPIPAVVAALRARFSTGDSRSLSERKRRLRRLKALLTENEDRFADALFADLGKSPFEAWTSEIHFVAAEIDHALAHLDSWAAPTAVATPILYQPARSEVRCEPLGVCLIIAPWNYPVHLTLSPLIAALSAGNAAALKPSELAPATASALVELMPRYLDPDVVAVVPGAVPETTELLAQRWDHIFFTGSERVGRIVMRAAAEHLTPVVLELGGKSPTIVDETAPLGVAARRIAWGRYWNAGQTCVAPDYVLVHRSREQALLEALGTRIATAYGPDPAASPDYSRIVHDAHFDRLVALLDGATVAHGGQHDRATRYFAPTVVTDVDPEGALMGEEIFGPILPVLPYDSLDEAIAFVNARPKPLALYVFTTSGATREAVLTRTSSGSVGVNQAMMQLGNPDLPFGGVGASGMGRYHASAGFESFSNRKAIMARSGVIDPAPMYPPYAPWKVRVSKILL